MPTKHREKGSRVEVLLEAIQSDFQVFGEKLDFVDNKVDRLDKKIECIAENVDKRMDGLDKRIDGLDKKVEDLTDRVKRGFEETDRKLQKVAATLSRKADVESVVSLELQMKKLEISSKTKR